MLSGKKRSSVIGIIIAAFTLGIAVFCVYNIFFSAALESTFEVSVVFYDTVNQEPLSGVSVICRRSHNRHSQEAVTDEEGRVTFDLSKGKYTLGWSMDGYYDGSQNISVREDVKLPPQYLVPHAGRREAYIVAVWDGEADIDLCVYSDREKRCVGRESQPGEAYVLGDIVGESYELAYLDDYTDGSYTVFVKDYSAAQGVQPKSIDIRIYTAEGLLYHEQTALSEPEAVEGDTALYECAHISGGAAEKSDRYIEDLTDYSWAARDKNDPAGWIRESVRQIKEVYSYDDTGELVKIIRTEYNEGGHVTLDAAYNRFGKCIQERTWVYADNGAVTEHSIAGYYNDEYRCYKTTYDAYENKISECIYDAFGSLQSEYRYEIQYDESGNILAEREFYINSAGEQFLSYEWTYDENGDTTSLHEYQHGLLMRQMESEYDENGKLKRQWWGFYNNVLDTAVYEADGDMLVAEYDTDGNEIKYTVYCYDENGELELDWWYEAQYDSEGNEILCRYFDENGELDWWWEAQYDSEGNEILCHHFYTYGDGIWNWWREAEYDSEGRLTASYTYRDERKILETAELYEHTPEGKRKIVYGYDTDGETIDDMELWEYNADGELTLHARTYDLETWVFRVETIYDERGNETAWYHYVDDMVLKYGYETEYDALDRMTVQRRYSSDGSMNVTTYTYTDVYDAAAGIVTTYKEIDGVIREKKITWYYP